MGDACVDEVPLRLKSSLSFTNLVYAQNQVMTVGLEFRFGHV